MHLSIQFKIEKETDRFPHLINHLNVRVYITLRTILAIKIIKDIQQNSIIKTSVLKRKQIQNESINT